jgi:hypothetical protein
MQVIVQEQGMHSPPPNVQARPSCEHVALMPGALAGQPCGFVLPLSSATLASVAEASPDAPSLGEASIDPVDAVLPHAMAAIDTSSAPADRRLMPIES